MSETMTPKELLELACQFIDPRVGAALRSYAELVAALEWLKERGWWSMAHYGPDEVVAYAKSVGWAGLEEL
jgi:hypothetical protein